MNRAEAASAVEDTLEEQARAYVAEDDGAPLDGYVMTNWIGLSAWSGVDSEGTEVSRIIVHLRDYQMPTWQIIGLLRAALLQHEAVYFDSGTE